MIWDKRGQNDSKVTNADECSKILEHMVREDVPRQPETQDTLFTSLTSDMDESYLNRGKNKNDH